MKRNTYVLCINPHVCDFKLYDEWMHPLGLYFLISLLTHNNWQTGFINCLEAESPQKRKRYSTGPFSSTIIKKPKLYYSIPRSYKRHGISKEILKKRLVEQNSPDIILLTSAMTYWIEGLAFTYQTIREIYPDVPIVIGGNSAQLMPRLIQDRFPDAIIFQGSFITDIIQLKNIYPIFNTLTADNWIPSLSEAFKMISHIHHAPILTSLGCPLRCEYCASRILQPRFYRRSKDVILNELCTAVETDNITDASFFDDSLLLNPALHAIPLFKDIASSYNNLRLHAPNGLHLRSIDESCAAAMFEARFITLRFGYESGKKEYKTTTSEKTTSAELQKRIKILLSVGFKPKNIGIYVMGGLPEQTPEMLLEDAKIITSHGVKAKPVFLSPVPGTSLFNFYAKKYPKLSYDPLWQNDSYFITKLPKWNIETYELTIAKIGAMNRILD